MNLTSESLVWSFVTPLNYIISEYDFFNPIFFTTSSSIIDVKDVQSDGIINLLT